MWFWITMLIFDLLLPASMIGFGYLMYLHPPKDINGVFGYRTSRSTKNLDTWKFAHDCCGRLWVKAGYILLAPTLLAMLPFIHSGKDAVGTASLVIESVQLAVMIGSIFIVESALNKNFDGDGNRL